MGNAYNAINCTRVSIWNLYKIMTLVDLCYNSNCYNLSTVYTNDSLFSKLRLTPFVYMCKCSLVPCTIIVSTLRGLIPYVVQNL